jgi:hypothetical protein
MAALTVTAANVRAMDGAVVQSFDLGGAADVGDLVYIASDGDVEKADASAQASAKAVGILTAVEGGESSGSSGDLVSVVLFGPVAGFSSMTPGANGYVSDTAGDIEDSAGTYDRIVGFSKSASVFFVSPEQNDPSSA